MLRSRNFLHLRRGSRRRDRRRCQNQEKPDHSRSRRILHGDPAILAVLSGKSVVIVATAQSRLENRFDIPTALENARKIADVRRFEPNTEVNRVSSRHSFRPSPP